MEFDPFSADFFDDPYTTYRWLRDQAPVYHHPRYGFWALSRFADVCAAHQDWRTFSSTHGVTIADLTDAEYMSRGYGVSIITMDPPAHDRLRKLVSRVFAPRAIEERTPLVRATITGFLDRLMERDAFDLVADFAAPFPVEVISALLGIPAGERQAVRERTDLVLHREPGNPRPTAAGVRAAAEQAASFRALVEDKRRRPADDLLTYLCQVEYVDDGGQTQRLSDEEIVRFATLLAAAGSETVTKLIGSGAVLFHRHPDEWRQVLDDPRRIPGAVEEILRYWAPSQYQGRFAMRPATLHGITIPARVPVLLLTGAASRDERAYPDPDAFDIDREQQIPIGFGYGVHSCLGAALARLESRIAFEEIRARWPDYAVDEAGCRRVHMANVAGFSHVPVRVRRQRG
jgi:cytochrome P450